MRKTSTLRLQPMDFLMTDLDIDKISKKIKSEIYKKFNILDDEMKKDLFQEAFLACLELGEQSDEKIHWAIVRSLSKFYWANISIVKRFPIKKSPSEALPKSSKDNASLIFDADIDSSGLSKFDIPEDFHEKSEEALKRVSREFFLIPEVKKRLSNREWEIIKDRVIASKESQKTRVEIGRMLQISSERVRQIEVNGLNKIKGVLENPQNPLHILHPSY